MCLEDIRLGRESSASYFQVTTNGSTARTLVPANPNRIRMVVSTAGGPLSFIGPRNTFASGSLGFALTTTAPILQLRIEEIGTAITQEWVCFDNGTPDTLSVIATELQKT